MINVTSKIPQAKQGIRILVQFGTFRAIDVFQKGSYGISCRVYKKQRVSGSNKRIDGIIIEDVLDLSNGAEYSRCSLSHSLCNWRCRPKTMIGSLHSKCKTRYTSPVFPIDTQGEHVPLDCAVLFDINVPINLEPSSIRQENCIYFDFELFFHASEKVESEVYQRSAQRRILQLNLEKVRDAIACPTYYSLEFDQVYCSATDLILTCFYTETNVNPTKPSLSRTASFNSITTLPKSRTWNWASLMNLVQHAPDQVENEDSNVMPSYEILDLFLMQLECITRLLIELYELSDHNELLSFWATVYKHCTIPVKEFEESNLPQKHELKRLALLIKQGDVGIAQEYQYAFQAFNPILDQLSMKWIQMYQTQAMDQMRDHRYTFRLSKLEIQVQSILDQPFREFHSKGSEAIVLANSKEPPQNMIEEWPKKPKTHLLTIQQTLADTISEQVDSQRDSQVGSQAVPKRTLSWAQKTSSDQIHLIVFVHGYLGNTYDLRRYRNQLLHHISDLGLDETHHSYLISAFNEQDTMSHLSTLGNNLAQEIWEHIFEYNLDDKLEKVSFVCHSMGALISRMAIRNDLLNPYKSKFYSFTSFASPHCSLLIHSHSILDPVIGLMQSIYKSDSLEQLYLQDHPDKRECLLYRLSQDPTMKYFDHVNLFASQQDQYVHFESALVSPLQEFKDYSQHDQDTKAVYREMVRNFTSNCKRLYRFEVWFQDLEEKRKEWSPSDPVGRSAHIAILEEAAFLELAVIVTRMHT